MEFAYRFIDSCARTNDINISEPFFCIAKKTTEFIPFFDIGSLEVGSGDQLRVVVVIRDQLLSFGAERQICNYDIAAFEQECVGKGQIYT